MLIEKTDCKGKQLRCGDWVRVTLHGSDVVIEGMIEYKNCGYGVQDKDHFIWLGVVPSPWIELLEPAAANGEELHHKYVVMRTDGCPSRKRYFVLAPEDDLVARRALEVYASWTENEALQRDLNAWLERMDSE
jgi:hypothetical protein